MRLSFRTAPSARQLKPQQRPLQKRPRSRCGQRPLPHLHRTSPLSPHHLPRQPNLRPLRSKACRRFRSPPVRLPRPTSAPFSPRLGALPQSRPSVLSPPWIAFLSPLLGQSLPLRKHHKQPRKPRPVRLRQPQSRLLSRPQPHAPRLGPLLSRLPRHVRPLPPLRNPRLLPPLSLPGRPVRPSPASKSSPRSLTPSKKASSSPLCAWSSRSTLMVALR